MRAWIPLSVALLLIAVGTWFHGTYTERWGGRTSAKLSEFTERVPTIPMNIGDWEGTEGEVDQEQFKASNCTACIERTYRNRATGESVSIFVTSGTGRNVTIHSPDWCYAAVGYVAKAAPVNHSIPVPGIDPAPQFATALFSKTDEVTGAQVALRILWSYSDNGQWRGPKAAKFSLTVRPALYKVYVIYNMKGSESRPISETPIPDFVRDVFPEINRALFAPAAVAGTASPGENA